jgi:hypothetical protein
MNYYAQGGQAHGLKSLTGHQIQTKDGVPSFGIGGSFQKYVMKPVTNTGMAAVKAVQNVPGIKQVSDVSTQAFKPIDQALVGLDKTVGKAIPGGWGTVAQVAGSFMGLPTPLMTTLGALNGSGVMRKGGNFNLQGALIGGATAYATSELGQYARGAAEGANAAGSTAAMLPESAYVIPGELGDIAVNSQGQLLNASGQVLNPATQAAAQGAINAAPTLANSAPYVSPSTLQDQYIQQGLQEQVTALRDAPSLFDKATSLSTYTKPFEGAGESLYNAGKSVINAPVDAVKAVGNYDYGSIAPNIGKTTSGIGNLLTGPAGTSAAASAASGVTSPLAMAGLATYGTMNLADLDAQRDYLKQQQAAGNIAQAEYDQALAEINRQRDYASDVVSKSPFSTNPSRDVSIGDTFYGRGNEGDNLYSRLTGDQRMYAIGGSVDDEYGMDEARGLNQGNLQNGLFGGGIAGYAAGGTPRFLSGGGDGMSDDIPATINGNQKARLADGEFVVPADVVSHLGNGSSKAGAKQLYSMMDKVRTARTGRKSQGKQINPRKYLAA